MIVNSSRYFVSVEYRGPERRSLQLQPDSTSRIDLAPGRYRESAKVPNSTIPPLATDYEFAASKRYRLEFRFVED